MLKPHLAVAAAALVVAFGARAADLTLGLSAEVTSLDPHYHNLTPNNNVADHVFDPLVRKDEKQKLVPGLATEWKTLDPLTWEFKLRKGVKFHDGSDFTAEDVVFTLDRLPKVPNSPSSFSVYSKQIKEIVVVDPHTIRFKTAVPYPLMPTDLGTFVIVSKKAAGGATTDDFNTGKAAIGTGPYRLVRYAKGDRVELARNDAWWGGRTPWEKVTFRMLTNDAARVAALLAGDVQAIENVPTADVGKLKTSPNVTLARVIGHRIIYLHMDSNRDKTPFAFDKQGKPLDKNPLKDVRVRQAISKAINRKAIVERVMEGEAIPSGQLMPEGFYGYSPKLKPEAVDAEGAKKLLADAGYPNGFQLTLHATNNRYVNDAKIAQAIAQMLARVGIETKVDAMPSSVFFPRATKLEFSFLQAGWGSDTGEASSPLKALLATFDTQKGMGNANRGRYSNTKVDALLEDALQTVDDIKREAYLQRATEIAIADQGIIPLHFQANLWAVRKGLTYQARTDERTYAWLFRQAK
jgi:peptide/nickel transport system substrate-binding protein